MPSCGDRWDRKCDLPANCFEWEDDGDAWRFLESRGFTQDHFLVKPPSRPYTLNDREVAAICFLIHEWDWDFEQGE